MTVEIKHKYRHLRLTGSRADGDMLNIFHVVAIRAGQVGLIQEGSSSQVPDFCNTAEFEENFERIPE